MRALLCASSHTFATHLCRFIPLPIWAYYGSAPVAYATRRRRPSRCPSSFRVRARLRRVDRHHDDLPPATFNHVTIAVPVIAAASPLAPHAEVCEQHQREGAAHGRDAPEERRHAAAVAVSAAIVSLAVSETHRC
ncbi:hypothetical protein ACCO45_005439 [Purpureocillium lilacinum]|uniref:Uncharacterized protein n=1 Tax=Purpureocillium lilacinum TaxID=33203 RepID=A0ACC4DVH3_PURLI